MKKFLIKSFCLYYLQKAPGCSEAHTVDNQQLCRYSKLSDQQITPSHLIDMNFDDLRSKAFDTAKLWATCDEALAQVDEAFGTPWQASRDTLNTSLSIADTKGIELEQFQGPDSPFRFPEIGTNRNF